MAIQFQKAVRHKRPLRACLVGYESTGKTWTALELAGAIAAYEGGRVALADTEGGSARIYADVFDFDMIEVREHTPENYVRVIAAAEEAGYKVLVFDSLSHEWIGEGGALELVDQEKAAGGYGWDKVTPRHRKVFDAILRSRLHVIATMRQKKAYVVEDKKGFMGRGGSTTMREVGVEPVQRDGMEFEFDLIGTFLGRDNRLKITKSRLVMPDGTNLLAEKVIDKPGRPLAETIIKWLQEGVEAQTPREAILEREAQVETTRGRGRDRLAPEIAAGAPVPLTMTRSIIEAGKVARPEGKPALMKYLGEHGYPSWDAFVDHGEAIAKDALALIASYDRSLPPPVAAEPAAT